MVRFAGLFRQLFPLSPRIEFRVALASHRAHRYTKGFPCWNHFVAMLFGQMARSLRETCGPQHPLGPFGGHPRGLQPSAPLTQRLWKEHFAADPLRSAIDRQVKNAGS